MDIVCYARALLQESGDAQRAIKYKKYLKSPFHFVGATKKDVNTIGARLKSLLAEKGKFDLLDTLEDFWSSGVHEEMTLAIVLAAKCVQIFDEAEIGDTFSRWIDQCHSWDHIDELCIRVTGVIVLENPAAWAIIEPWFTNGHMWKRRASLISHLPSIRAHRPSVEMLYRTCEHLASEKDFFIRKAIGWTLRELAEHDLNSMISIYSRLDSKLSGIARREATRKLGPSIRDSLLAGPDQSVN